MINKQSLQAVIFIALLTALRIYYICTSMVIDDEAYYYVWSNHLSNGYIDGGPTIAYVIRLFVILFGANGFSVRIGAVLLSAAMEAYLFFWAKKNFNEISAFLLLIFISISPICFLSSIVHTYDTEMAVFMLLAIAFYYDAFFVDPRKFYYAGVLLGIALLSKISVAFSAIALFLMPFLIKELRHHLKTKEFYLSFLIAATIFSPMIFWDVSHDLAFTKFRTNMILRPGTFTNFVKIWGLQAIIFMPILFWFSIKLPLLSLIKSIQRRPVSPKALYFSWLSLLPLGYFLVGTMIHHYNGNWLVPAFFGGIFMTSVHFSEHWTKLRLWAFAQIALSATIIILFFSAIYFDFPNIAGIDKFSNRYYSYRAIPDELNSYLQNHQELRSIRIVSDNYQIPSLVNLYVKPETEAIGLSFDGYHDTLYSMLYPERIIKGQPLLFLCNGERFPRGIQKYFVTTSPIKTFISRRHGKEVNKLTLWYTTGYTGKNEIM